MTEYVKRIDMIKRYLISIADGGSVVLDSEKKDGKLS